MTEPTTARIAARLRAAGCVWADDEAAQLVDAARSPAELEQLVARRVAGEPLEHVVGWADFAGVRLRVGPGVFVPRRRSQHLVDTAAAWIRVRPRCGADNGRAAGPRDAEGLLVLDLCAGSGALGLALHHRAGPFRLVATDIDPVAAACAVENLAAVGGTVVVGDLFDAVPSALRGRLGLIVANAPYVPNDQLALMPREARDHEPAAALDGGADGLKLHRRLLAQAPRWLAPGAAVMLEVSDRQVAAAESMVRSSGLVAVVRPSPDDRRTVVVVGQLCAGSSSGPALAAGK